MSERDEIAKCITPDGESYADHYLPAGAGPEDAFICQRCFAFDEDAAVDEIERLRAMEARVLALCRKDTPDWRMEYDVAQGDLLRAITLIAANVRHLPSLPDDPEAVKRVARFLAPWLYEHGPTNLLMEKRRVNEKARDLLRALAGGES